jgi:fermentation-respiration switch protein FrsA (DUF1100 family)
MALLLSSCSGLLYYPSRQLFVDPARLGLKPEEVQFPSADGTKLSGWYFRNRSGKKPEALLIQYHGNAENLSSHFLSLAWILDHPYDLFIFDYRGYGRSEGSPNPSGTVADGEAALRWARAREPQLPLVVVGQSLGGAIALRNVIDLKQEIPVRLVVADCTFPSYRGIARKVMTRSWVTWPFQWLGWLLMSDAHAPKGEIDQISPTPLLVIHGDADPVVEFELGEAVYLEAKEPKEFWRIPGGEHTDAFTRPEWREKFLARLKKAVKD